MKKLASKLYMSDTNRIGERAEPWPMPMLTSKKKKEKLFHIY